MSFPLADLAVLPFLLLRGCDGVSGRKVARIILVRSFSAFV